jgi:PAS domain S-box-containing protein
MIIEATASELRKTGISAIGDMRWGTHFCYFYETKQDLLETLVLYFKEGIESKEFCVWVVSHTLSLEEAKHALGRAVPDLERHLAEGTLEIHSHHEWYLRDGRWDSQRVLQAWREKINRGAANGHVGLRAAGDGSWIQNEDWMAFREYENQVSAMIADQRSIILCTYPLTTSPADRVFDVAHIHDVAVARRNGTWETIEIPALKEAKAAIRKLNRELEEKVEERTRELVATNEALRAEIAERKLAEEAVKRAENRIRLVIDTTPALIHTGRPDGHLDYFNQRWLEYVGLSLEEIKGWAWTNVIHPEDVDGMVKEWRAAIASGEPFAYEARVRRAEGEYRWMLHHKVPLRDEQGDIVRWYGSSIDIEDRKRAEMQSWVLIDAIPHQIWSAPPDGALDYCNARWRSYMGIGLKDLQGEGWQTMLHPNDRDRVLKAWHESVVNGTPYGQEERHRGADGTYRWFLTRGVPRRDAEGRIVRWYGTNTDIEDRKQAEKALNAQARRYKTLMETSTDSIYVLDENGDLQEANVAFLRRRGYTAAEVKGSNVADWDARWTREQLQERLRKLVGGDAVFETRHRCKDGSIFDVEVCATSVRIGGEQLFFCVTRDITERKQAEQALRESEQRFRELAENINEVFWLSDDQNTRMHYISPAYEKVWGRSCESLYAAPKSWMDAVHPEDKQQVLATVAKRSLNETYHNTYRIVRPDGSIRWIRDRGFPVRDESGEAVRFAGIAEDITESKAIAKALESAEEQYRSIFNNAVNGIFRTSPDGKLLVANPAAARIFGFASQEESIEARSDVAQAYVDPRRREELKRLLQEHGAANGFEFEAYRKDGSRVWICENTRAVKSPSGEVLYFEGIFEDVTERKLAEERLRESEERFRTIFEQAPLGISEGEIATARFISANQRYIDILGYTADELRKLTFRDYTHPDDLEKDLVEFQKLATGEIRTYAMEKRYVRKDGAIIWVNLTVTGLANPGAKPLHCIAVIEDITDRIQAEDSLRRSEEKFKTLFDIAPVGISVLDRQFNVVDSNPALEQITRLSKEELLDGAWRRRSYLNADGTPKLLGELPSKRAMAENRRINDVETGIVTENGEIIWTQVSVAPLALPDASAVVITQDITERKRAAEELEEANHRLRFLSRRRVQMQEDERKHLARELHDQIGQALTAAKISVQSARRSRKRDTLDRHLEKAMVVLDQILVQVRQMTLDLRPAALDDLGLVPALRLVLHDYARRAGWHMQFLGDSNLERPDAEVETACFRITLEALANILRHARARKVSVQLHRAADSLHLIVRDDGVGFDLADAEKRIERDRLGLLGMRERAIGVGGAFECRSVPGQGTEVHAFLPLNPI